MFITSLIIKVKTRAKALKLKNLYCSNKSLVLILQWLAICDMLNYFNILDNFNSLIIYNKK